MLITNFTSKQQRTSNHSHIALNQYYVNERKAIIACHSETKSTDKMLPEFDNFLYHHKEDCTNPTQKEGSDILVSYDQSMEVIRTLE